MNERIINILKQCMTARERGIDLDYTITERIILIQHKGGEFDAAAYLNISSTVNQELAVMENYLYGLLGRDNK